MIWIYLGLGIGISLLLGAIGGFFFRYTTYKKWKNKNKQLAYILQQRSIELEAKNILLETNQRNFATLSEIGQNLTATFDFEVIFDRLYTQVNALMDAECFSVDIYYQETHEIEYKFLIEKGERIEPIRFSATEDNFSSVCIDQKREIFINNVEQEYQNYVSKILVMVGEYTHSILCVPLIVADRVIGAISTQSFSKNAYTQQDLNILRTLAAYTAIALNNALNYEKLNLFYQEIEHSAMATTDSIQYARRIQEAILPDSAHIKSAFDDSFIFYAPRDIVSGDFYWFTLQENHLIIAVVDCTGHGVPGAFMSVLGCSLLNQIILENHLILPHLILHRLNESVQHTLRQNESNSDSNDGMDIALVVVELKQKTIHFAGANRPFYYLEDGNVKVQGGDRYPIGGRRNDQVYQTYSYNYANNPDGFTFYLSTDGYTDQFGGANKRKFSQKAFIQVLTDIQELPLHEQGQALQNILLDWMGTHKQIDDILVIGARVK